MQEKQRAEHLLVAVTGLARQFELQYLIFASNATKTRTCSSGLGLQWGQTCADRTLQSAHCQPRVLLNTGGKLYNKSVPLYCVLCTVYCGDHSTLELTGDWPGGVCCDLTTPLAVSIQAELELKYSNLICVVQSTFLYCIILLKRALRVVKIHSINKTGAVSFFLQQQIVLSSFTTILSDKETYWPKNPKFS